MDRCEILAIRLRECAVRLWFDKWQLLPGDHLHARIDEAIRKSRKMVAVWTASYFHAHKVWTLAEGFAQQQADILAKERPLIPLLYENCDIPPLFRSLIYIDFRETSDFDLRFQELLQALDLPERQFAAQHEPAFREHALDPSERGRLNQEKGDRFEDEVAALYRLLGFEAKRDVQLAGLQIDLVVQQRLGGARVEMIVESKNKRVGSQERDQILAQQNVAQKQSPSHRWVVVSSQGFTAEARSAFEAAGVACTTYAELLCELVPLDKYVDRLIRDYETWTVQNWQGEDRFIRPDILTDITYERRPALEHIGKWLGDPRANLLVVLGDLGTGKSTLAKFLAYNLGRSFRDDPLRHPAPVLIPLNEVRKEVSLEGIIVTHLSHHGLSDVSYPRFEHLVRIGKIVVLFDAFDEMAARIRWEETSKNFSELRRAAETNGKVFLTCSFGIDLTIMWSNRGRCANSFRL
jgi:hypothetical protein